ncbi:MAG: tetratricopeptide repeat protein [Deltaproteobacteria bacterium]|nr:tetratricopeptide repeat protein [Deltaproteobacteria bacterium]
MKKECWNVPWLLAVITASMLIAAPRVDCSAEKPSDRVFAVHIASFQHFKGVESIITALQPLGKLPFYRKAEITGKGTWYRVYEGPYSTKAQAQAAALSLAKLMGREKYSIHALERGAERTSFEPASAVRKAKVTVADDSSKKSDLRAARQVAKETAAPDSPQNDSPGAAGTVDRTPSAAASKVLPGKAVQQESGAETAVLPEGTFGEALKNFAEERYGEALTQLNSLINDRSLGPTERERALRRLADSHYFLGMKGDSRHYMEAVDIYRLVLSTYPNAKEENAEALHRMGRSYENSKMYMEARREYARLLKLYPASPVAAETLFLKGRVSILLEQYNEAIDAFERYVKSYAGGAYAVDAHFLIGDCCSQLKKFDEADRWYQKALDKLPSIDNMPKDMLSKAAMYYSKLGRHDRSLEAYLRYVNLYPEDESNGTLFIQIAESFKILGKPTLALLMMNRVVEFRPDSPEAAKSAFMMASLGVKDPFCNLSDTFYPGIEPYRHPTDTFDRLIAGASSPAEREELIFKKGMVLREGKRYEEAFKAFSDMLAMAPRSSYAAEAKKQLVDCAEVLVPGLAATGDHLGIGNLYFKAAPHGLAESASAECLIVIAESLAALDLVTDVQSLLKHAAPGPREYRYAARVMLIESGLSLAKNDTMKAEELLNGILAHGREIDEKTRRQAQERLADLYHDRGRYAEALSIYADVIGRKEAETTARIYKKYADCLRALGHEPSALVYYKKAADRAGQAKSEAPKVLAAEAYEALGDCLYAKGNYRQATIMFEKSREYRGDDEDPWLLYNIGRGYLFSGDQAGGEKIFSSLKEKRPDEFWQNIIDYSAQTKAWNDRFGKYLQEG